MFSALHCSVEELWSNGEMPLAAINTHKPKGQRYNFSSLAEAEEWKHLPKF